MSEKYHPALDDPNAWVPYRYHPTKVGAIVFLVLFAATTLLHSFQLIKRRTWYFIPLILGGIFEILGYLGRLLSATGDLWALGPYIMQSLLILIAPALFAASIYIILGRIILLVNGEQYSLIKKKWLTKVFVCGDILSFFVQGAGGGIQAGGSLSMFRLGEKLIIIGLFIQLVFFGFFIVVALTFHLRLVKHCGNCSTLRALPWKRHLHGLYVASALIMIRSVFRVIEYLMGNNGYLLRHEVFLYIFDALLMFLVMVWFNWVHPSEITSLMEPRKRDEVILMEDAAGRPSGYSTVHSDS